MRKELAATRVCGKRARIVSERTRESLPPELVPLPNGECESVFGPRDLAAILTIDAHGNSLHAKAEQETGAPHEEFMAADERK
jgi:hypothetical protein